MRNKQRTVVPSQLGNGDTKAQVKQRLAKKTTQLLRQTTVKFESANLAAKSKMIIINIVILHRHKTETSTYPSLLSIVSYTPTLNSARSIWRTGPSSGRSHAEPLDSMSLSVAA